MKEAYKILKQYLFSSQEYHIVITRTVQILYIMLALTIGRKVFIIVLIAEIGNFIAWYRYKRTGKIKEKKEKLQEQAEEIKRK